MIINVSDAAHPPGDLRPRTLRAALAIILEPLAPGASITITGIKGLSGLMVTPQAIRSAVCDTPIPDRTHSVRHIKGGAVQLWRNT